MLLVLLLLVLHRAVLPTGIAAVLRSDAVAVFGDVTVGGQKVSPAALALAGCVAVVQSVHQVIGVEIGQAWKNHPFHKHHFFFVFRTAGKHIGGGQLRVDRERLHIQALQTPHLIPKLLAVEAVICGHGEMCFVPFFQTAQIIQLKEPPRRIEVIHSDRDAYDPDAESQELCLELRIGRPYLGECALVKQDIDPAHFLLIVIITKGRILPKKLS